MTTTTPNHRPADQILDDQELATARAAALRSNKYYRLDKGYTAADVAEEALANIRYHAQELAKAEALLALTATETAVTPR